MLIDIAKAIKVNSISIVTPKEDGFFNYETILNFTPKADSYCVKSEGGNVVLISGNEWLLERIASTLSLLNYDVTFRYHEDLVSIEFIGSNGKPIYSLCKEQYFPMINGKYVDSWNAFSK